MSKRESRDPSRGNAWNSPRSPIPIPTMPLRKKIGKARPDSPIPSEYDHAPRKIAAQVCRQKFASVPPISFADRWPLTTEIENRIVLRNAAHIAKNLEARPQKLKAYHRKRVRLQLSGFLLISAPHDFKALLFIHRNSRSHFVPFLREIHERHSHLPQSPPPRALHG